MWANVAARGGQGQFGQILIPSLWLVGALLLGALVLFGLQRWRKNPGGASSDPVHEQLTHFRTMFEQGRMSEQEYKRVHALLSERLQEQLRANAANSPARPAASEGDAGGNPAPEVK